MLLLLGHSSFRSFLSKEEVKSCRFNESQTYTHPAPQWTGTPSCWSPCDRPLCVREASPRAQHLPPPPEPCRVAQEPSGRVHGRDGRVLSLPSLCDHLPLSPSAILHSCSFFSPLPFFFAESRLCSTTDPPNPRAGSAAGT